MSTLSSDNNSSPSFPDDISRGSSVSSTFQNEYEEILKYALVAPKIHIEKDVYAKDEQVPSDNTSTTTTSMSSTTHEQLPQPRNKSYMTKKEQTVKFHMHSGNALDTLLDYSAHTPAKGKVIQHPVSTESTPESIQFQSPSGVDKDLIRMEGLLDDWLLQLKRNVITELGDMKLRQVQSEETISRELKARHSAETMRLNHDIENLKELLFTFEQSVNQKDEVIKNLTDTLNKQKEKCDKIRLFGMWRLKHSDEQRQGFSAKMADKYYNRMLCTKVWIGWRSVVESKWRERVEKACKIKSQEVCLKLTEDYEERLQGLHQELKSAREEISRLHTERDHYEENMKKAFMRGVCALNMEALSMFKEGGTDNVDEERHDIHPSCIPPNEYHNENVQKQTINATVKSGHIPSNKQVTFNNASLESVKDRISSTTYQNKNTTNRKNINLKMTGKRELSKKDSNNTVLRPSTISSVKVERHLPLDGDDRNNRTNKRQQSQKSVPPKI